MKQCQLLSWLLGAIGVVQCAHDQGGSARAADPYTHGCEARTYNMKIDRDGCDRTFHLTQTCAGVCASSSEPSEDYLYTGLFTETCKCCEPTTGAVVHVDVQLNCSGGQTRTVQIPLAQRCTCRPCGPVHSAVGPGNFVSSASKAGELSGPDSLIGINQQAGYDNATVSISTGRSPAPISMAATAGSMETTASLPGDTLPVASPP